MDAHKKEVDKTPMTRRAGAKGDDESIVQNALALAPAKSGTRSNFLTRLHPLFPLLDGTSNYMVLVALRESHP